MMSSTMGKVVITIVIVVMVKWVWKVLYWAWFKPKKLEKWLRSEGYKGNSYKLLRGDIIELAKMIKEANSNSIPITHDITSLVLPFDHHIITKYGKKSFMWFGPNPRIYVTDPELIKEILSRPNEFQKPHPDPFNDNVIGGLLASEGPKWTKHRKIINPAFHFENIKMMFLAMSSSCNEMVNKWELLTNDSGSAEVDVWPYISNLAGEVISRTAFGSSYEEGRKIFRIQKEQIDIAIQLMLLFHLPGGRFIPTKTNKKFQKNRDELRVLLLGIINKKKKAIEMGEGCCNDLLGVLLESNSKEIEEEGVGLSMEDVIEECKLFYVAGSETTSNLIAWTMVCLSLHQEWQTEARRETLEVFGTEKPDFEGLKRLKIVTMVLNEVLRLYPPAVMIIRATPNETKLGNMTIPSGVHLTLPIIKVHHDREIWGENATEFNPERFSEGVSCATKGKGSYSFLPFSGGPRVCIGQNFGMTEAKVAIATILQRFTFELSPSYKHSMTVYTLAPVFGVHLILHKI